MTERSIRVVIADDQEMLRHGFAALVDAEEGLEVVGLAADGVEAIDRSIETAPDVVLMDVRMPNLDGVEATRRIAADDRLASTRVIILTAFDLEQYVYDALRAGASGYLLKDTAPTQLLEAIRVVAAGDALITPSITKRMIAEFAARPSSTDAERLDVLTERERDVLELVARGLNNAEIGEELIISPLTAKTHVSRLLSKLQVRDRAQLVALAYETGLVVPGS